MTKAQSKNNKQQDRSWALIVLGSIMILLGAALIVIAILEYKRLGWWSVGMAVSGLTTIYFAARAIKENKPEWILLDLILPG